MNNFAAVDILLVEDNPNDAELAFRNLKKNNLANNVHWAKDGQEALDYIFRNGEYENRRVEDNQKVILLDLKLPKVDGMEILRKVKSDERTSQAIVVIMTSSREESDVNESRELGVDGFITKPVDFVEFTKVASDLRLHWLLLDKPPG
ncbi:MAG: response regulator [Thermoleophilia bacterium]